MKRSERQFPYREGLKNFPQKKIGKGRKKKIQVLTILKPKLWIKKKNRNHLNSWVQFALLLMSTNIGNIFFLCNTLDLLKLMERKVIYT